MGFFSQKQLESAAAPKNDFDFYHKRECKVCPLNTDKNLQHPKMLASGSLKPLVYILGEAPGQTEDDEGKQFVGKSGKYLRQYLPKELGPQIRWNNTIRCHPPNNRNPEEIEVECCRPSIEQDIARTKPTVIFGMGGVPLRWALKQSGIDKWRGRRVPVNIGGHSCWYFPMYHPSYLVRLRDSSHMQDEKYFKQISQAFRFDIDRALDFLMAGVPPAVVHTRMMAQDKVDYIDQVTPDALAKIERFLEEAPKSGVTGLDIETTELRPYRDTAHILSVAIATRDRSLAFLFDHPKRPWPAHLFARLVTALRKFIMSKAVKAVHNLPFELEWLGVRINRGLIRAPGWEDSMSQAAVLDERVGEKVRDGQKIGGMQCLGLGWLTLQYFGLNIKTLTDINTKRIIDEPIDDMLFYNALDAKYHRLLFLAQFAELQSEKLLDFYDFHKRRLPTIVLTQIKGVPVDDGEAATLEKELTKQITATSKAIAADENVLKFEKKQHRTFKPTSPNDCTILIRDIIGSTAGKLQNGKYSVTESVLSGLKEPIGKKIVAFRKPSKLLSTYVWRKDSPIVYPDGLLHPILNPNYAESGRTSSEDPNEQNMPKHTGEGKKIRKQIRAPNGHIIFSLDYGQIEARCIAMASRDKAFVKALWENYDVHMDWALRISKKHPHVLKSQTIKDFRQKVKGGWVFAGFFDARVETMSKQVGIEPDKRLYDEFWDVFSGVRRWQDELKRDFDRYGYLESLLGRRRRAPLSPNQIVNTSIQGLAADIVIDGMNALSETGDWDLQPFLNIHDDLSFLFPEDRFEELSYEAVDTLLSAKYDFLNVPLVVEASVGPSLYEMEEAAKYSSADWKKAT